MTSMHTWMSSKFGHILSRIRKRELAALVERLNTPRRLILGNIVSLLFSIVLYMIRFILAGYDTMLG